MTISRTLIYSQNSDREDVPEETQAQKPRRRIWLDTGLGSVTITRGKKSRNYPLDRYPMTETSSRRLFAVLDRMKKIVELDDDFTALIYFHS